MSIYRNIHASIEQLTDGEIKQDLVNTLESFSDEQLQKINRYSSVFDFFILKKIENQRPADFDFVIKYDLLNISDDKLDKMIKIMKREELSYILKPKYRYLFDELWNLNDHQFARIMEEPGFIRALANIGAIGESKLIYSGYDGSYLKFFRKYLGLSDQKLDESFDKLIENKDLVLICSLLLKRGKGAYEPTPDYDKEIYEFVYRGDREDMKKALYNLNECEFLRGKNKYGVYDKQIFDRMVSNSKATKQLLYSDVHGNITETIEALISGQTIKKYIPGFRLRKKSFVGDTKSGNSPAKLEDISIMKFAAVENKEHLIQDYKKKCIEYSRSV